MSGHLITWPSLSEKLYEEQPFLIDPYIPVDSIVFLFGATSTGKCFAPGTLILMADGTKRRVEDILVGDEVMGPDSLPRKVLELHTGNSPMWRITPTVGTSWECNEGHSLIWETQAGFTHISPAGGYLPKRTYLKHVAVELPSQKLPIEPYLLGLLLGDGHLHASVQMTTADKEIVEEIYKAAASWDMRVTRKGKYTYKMIGKGGKTSYPKGKRDRGRTAHVRNPIYAALKDLGLSNLSSGDKFIPDIYLRGSKEQRKELLAGLLDTDGSGRDYISKSPRLAEGVVWLAQSLGYRASIRECLKDCQTGAVGIYYRVYIAGSGEEIPTRLLRKRLLPLTRSRTGFTQTPVGEGTFYGFSVDRDHLFLLGDCTVVHNSPTSWEMARAIGTGQSFFGLPTQKGRVLYIDCDSPERVAAERLRKVPSPPEEVYFYFTSPLSIPNVSVETMEELVRVKELVQPDVVFINTLRKVHDLDDKDSKTPKIVYSFWTYLFPNTSLVFIHHPRKSQTGQGVVEVKRETFSGSMAWLNDAQVGLMLQKYNATDGMANLRLYHVKSQATQLVKPLPLFLADDGVSLSSPLYRELLCVYETLHEHYGKSKGEIDKVVAGTLGCSVATARRRREEIEKGHFPGSRRWLGRDDEEE